MQYATFKRLLDIIISLIALIVLFPFLLIFALGIKLDSYGPVLFFQERTGRFGNSFKIWKFRTMQVNTPERSTEELGDDSQYTTRYGHLLRKFGIDELPQLINVLKGDMSLIGPRPVILSETKLTKLRTKNGALAIRPGLSGWAQVNGRDAVSIGKKAEYDGYYAQNMSFFFDVGIFFLSIASVVTHNGYKEGKIIKKSENSRLFNRIDKAFRRKLKKKEQDKKKMQKSKQQEFKSQQE